MAGFIGMDPAAAKALANKMNSTAQNILQQVQSLTGAVDGVQWKGPDAERFKQEWRGTCVPTMKKIAETLRTNATKLNKEATEQIAVSK